MVMGGWIVATQVCSTIARASLKLEVILAVLAAASLIISGFIWRRKAARNLSLIAALVLFAASVLVYKRGDWTEAYRSDAMLRHYGMDVFRLKDQQEFQQKLRTGQIDWVDSQRVLASMNPTQFDMVLFKARRYIRQTFWPPLQYQAWKREQIRQAR
jgi:hypothetical protein